MISFPTRRQRRSSRLLVSLVIGAFLLSSVSSLFADDNRERRLKMGMRLFPRLLAADLGLDQKVSDDGTLLLVVFHMGDRSRGDQLVREFAGPPEDPQSIKRIPLVVHATSNPDFTGYENQRIAGIFIADEPDPATLARIVRYGIERRVIVYSPFDGHVERGVLGGLSIGAKVEPFVNLATLRASGIELKELFLRVTKVYQ